MMMMMPVSLVTTRLMTKMPVSSCYHAADDEDARVPCYHAADDEDARVSYVFTRLMMKVPVSRTFSRGSE